MELDDDNFVKGLGKDLRETFETWISESKNLNFLNRRLEPKPADIEKDTLYLRVNSIIKFRSQQNKL